MKDFRNILVWQRCHSLTLKIYQHTKLFPKDELFGMISQMRRAASSMPANISEGCGRDGDRELRRFPTIALGSACELDYFILLAGDLGYLQPKDCASCAAEILEIRRMLGGFIKKLKA